MLLLLLLPLLLLLGVEAVEAGAVDVVLEFYIGWMDGMLE
jgi:hypothetical protein